jgi:hypothetical protein
VAAGAAQFESAERPQAVVLRRPAVAVPVPVHFFPEAVPAHFFAEAAVQVQRSAQPEAQHSVAPAVLAGQAVARLPEELAARDVAAVLLRVAGHAGVAPEAAQDAAEEPRQEAAAWGAAAVLQLEAAAARGAAGVLQPGAAVRAGVAEAVRQPAARDAAEVLLRVAPGARVGAARPSAVLSVFHRDRLHRRPAPSPAARFAHAMKGLQIASP